jgi:hypothetical protein
LRERHPGGRLGQGQRAAEVSVGSRLVLDQRRGDPLRLLLVEQVRHRRVDRDRQREPGVALLARLASGDRRRTSASTPAPSLPAPAMA